MKTANRPDENVRLELERPRSAWNSRSSRRPEFTFFIEEATDYGDKLSYDDNDKSTTSDAKLRKSRSSGCFGDEGRSTPAKPPRTTGRRSSMIPVRTDRLQPSTTDNMPRRHSYASMLDLSRDVKLTEQIRNEQQQIAVSPRPKPPGLTSSCSTPSLVAARRRVLARLAGAQSPPPTPDKNRRHLPRKLDPIIYESEDVDDKPVVFTIG